MPRLWTCTLCKLDGRHKAHYMVTRYFREMTGKSCISLSRNIIHRTFVLAGSHRKGARSHKVTHATLHGSIACIGAQS